MLPRAIARLRAAVPALEVACLAQPRATNMNPLQWRYPMDERDPDYAEPACCGRRGGRQ